MTGIERAVLIATVGFAVSSPWAAAASEPIYVRNLSPIAALFGIPAQRSAFTTGAGDVAAALHGSLANHYVEDGSPREFLNLDGETGRLALELRYGLAEGWDLQLEVPWIDQSGGNLDGVIDDWHDLWGMADGGRSDVPHDLLAYQYASARAAFDFERDRSGLGDIGLALNYAFYRTPAAAASAALGYKFGTGDADDFTGSGADDVYLALRLSGDHLSDLPLVWHGQLGYLHAGDSDLIGDVQKDDLWFAGLAVDWRLHPHWSLLAQIDSHAAPLHSGLTATGDEAFLLTVGGRWHATRHWQLDFNIVEDIRVETAPDVTFQLSVRFQPDS